MTTTASMIGSARRPAAALAAVTAGLLLFSQAPSQAASAAPAYGTWTLLSPSGVNIYNSDEPVVVRFGSEYQVEWAQHDNGSGQDTLVTRVLDKNGRPLTGVRTVVGPQPLIDEHRALLAVGGERVTVYSGIKGTTGVPFTALTYAVSTDNGRSWTPSGVPLTTDPGYYSEGIAAVNEGGTPIAGMNFGQTVEFTDGLAAAPATGSANNGDLGGYTYRLGLGYEPKTKETWAAWYTIGGSHDGFSVQELSPALGPIQRMPGQLNEDPGQDFTLAARPASLGGGLYTAYPAGTYLNQKVALWRIGSTKPLYIPTSDAYTAGVAAGPGGRIWVFWRDKGTSVIKFARTNPVGTRLGAVGTVPTPKGVSYWVWDVAGDASAGPLQLVINAQDDATGANRIWSAQVLPRLSAAASPAKISYAKGGKVTVTLTDAGAAVPGASVTYAGTTRKTNARGQVIFTVAAHTKKGKHTISYSCPGYSSGSMSFTVA